MKNKVIAKLVATYDLSSGNNKDVKSINYFNIYEYEYNGKKYKIVFHFSKTPPHVIKVYFNKNPKDVFYYTD